MAGAAVWPGMGGRRPVRSDRDCRQRVLVANPRPHRRASDGGNGLGCGLWWIRRATLGGCAVRATRPRSLVVGACRPKVGGNPQTARRARDVRASHGAATSVASIPVPSPMAKPSGGLGPRRLPGRPGRRADRPEVQREDDPEVGEVHGERRHLGCGRVAQDRPQELTQDEGEPGRPADERLVRKNGRQVVGWLGADADRADLDELVDRLAEEPGSDEDQGDPGPAEEDLQVQAAAATVEAGAQGDRDRQTDDGPPEQAPRPLASALAERGGLADEETVTSRSPRGSRP